MARTANRYLQTCIEPLKVYYKTAVYLRLSVESKKKDSESIENQRLLIKEYLVRYPELNDDVHEYSDDGRSGTNLDRVEFKALISDIQAGKINCVIVKDLSRFARNYIEAGEYLEKIFPYLGIRFISLAEEYDSADPNSTKDQLAMNLKNLINELYARDGSKKVHTSYRIKQEANIFYRTSTVPYGYKMGEKGASKHALVNMLAKINLLPPKQYRQTGKVMGDDKNNPVYWHISTIDRILKNEVYIGHIIRHKTEQKLFEDMPNHTIPEEEWVHIKDNHTPLIPTDLFNRVQKRLAEMKNRFPASGKPTQLETVGSHPEVFMEHIFCGNCGSRLRRYGVRFMEDGRTKRYMEYCCSNYRLGRGCQNTAKITEADLFHLVERLITDQIKSIGNEERVVKESIDNVFQMSIRSSDRALKNIQTQLSAIKKQKFEQYAKYANGEIKKEVFTSWKQKLADKQGILEIDKTSIAKKIRNLRNLQKESVKHWKQYIKNGRLDLKKSDIHFFISGIKLYENKKIEIQLSYPDVWDSLLKQKRGDNLA